MTLDDRPQFVAALKRLFGGWNQEPSDQQLASWWAALRDLPLSRVTDAMRRTLRDATGSYPPPPATVRKSVRVLDDAGPVPDAARHAPDCQGSCGWAYVEQRHPEAGTGCYTSDATRTRVVRGCRHDLAEVAHG